MMLLLLRFLLLALLIFIVYRIIVIARNPSIRLEYAKKTNRYFLLDDPKNARMNLLLTYKGFLFEGEKYVHAKFTNQVDSILIWPTEPYDTKLTEEDIHFIESSLRSVYTQAKIQWKYPTK